MTKKAILSNKLGNEGDIHFQAGPDGLKRLVNAIVGIRLQMDWNFRAFLMPGFGYLASHGKRPSFEDALGIKNVKSYAVAGASQETPQSSPRRFSFFSRAEVATNTGHKPD